MLSRFHKILIGLLAIQVVLAVVMLTRHDDSAARKPEPLLAGFDAAKITRLAVYSKDTAKPAIELARQGAGWVLASSYDYPVTESKVNALLASLAKLAAPAPIATQPARQKQLHVAASEFERKLVLTAGATPTTLFVGSSVGARRSAVRLGDDPRIYAVGGLTAYSIGDEPRQWVDTKYVAVNKDELAKVTIDHGGTSIALERDGDHWKAAVGGTPLALAANETLDTSKIDQVVAAASSIELTSPADPKRDASKPTATITLMRKAKTTSSPAPVVIDVVADGGSYWVHDRASPRAVTVDKTRLADVVELTRDKLVKKLETTAKPEPGKPAAKHAG